MEGAATRRFTSGCLQWRLILRRTSTVERERIVADPGSSLRSFGGRVDHFRFNPHHHPEVELTLIVAGSGLRTVGDSVERFTPGDVVLVGTGVVHSWSSPPGAGAESLVVQFPARLLAELPEARRLAEVLERARLGLHGPPTAAALVHAVHDPLARLGRLLDAVAAAAAWPTLARAAPRQRARDPRLGRALAWLHAHASEPIELRALANRVAMSPPALSRSFRRALGMGAAEYLARMRVQAACAALAGADDEVAAVGFAAGFGNLGSFHRWFRRVTGQTPEAWRQAARGV